MTTGIKAAGVDLDSIFEPRTTTKIANVNIKSNGGVDISNRFEDIASGSGPSATGIKKAGTDLNLLFAELGSVGPTVSAQANGQISTIEGLGGLVFAGVQFNTSGTEFEVTQSTGNYDVNEGTWLDTGSSSQVWVEFVKTGGTGFWNVLNPLGRNICSGSPSWKMHRITFGQSQVIGFFRFWDAASGGNILQTTPTVEWSAERTPPPPEVSAQANGQISTIVGLGGLVFAGVRFHSNGEEFEVTQSTGNFDVSQGDWLDVGVSSDVWVEFTKTGGTGNWNVESQSGRNNLATIRSWKMHRITIGRSQVIGYFRFWDAASGGNLLQQTPTVEWSAERTTGVIVLTGYSSSFTNSGGVVHSGIAFQPDGTIDDVGPGALDRTQVNAGEWWSTEPETAIGDNYDIRCATISGGPWTNQAASVGTYIQINAERRWSVRLLAMDSPATFSCTGIPFEIRRTGLAPVLDSANHSGEAIN